MSCSRAEQLVEELLDDALDEPTRESLEAHLHDCPRCRQFCRAASTVRDALVAEEPLYPSAEAVARMGERLARKIGEQGSVQGRPRRLPRWVAVGGLAAAAAVVAVLSAAALGAWLDAPEGSAVAEGPAPVAEQPAPAGGRATPPGFSQLDAARGGESPPAAVASVSGTARVLRGDGQGAGEAGSPLGAGDRVETGAASVATLALGDGARVALGPGSRVALEGLADRAQELRLEEGWIVCSVDPVEGDRRFVVAAGETTVTVVGTVFAVEATRDDSVEVRVSRGRVAVRHGEADEVALSAGERGTFPSGRVAQAPGRVAARDEGLLRGELLPEPERIVPASVSVGDLFRHAEEARSRGDFTGAAADYRRIAAMDRGASGGTALISLGQLSLGPRRRPAEARRAFATYLRRHGSGPMRQEALVGLMRAEAALGNTDGARRAARRYLDAYPSGRYAGRARALVDTSD